MKMNMESEKMRRNNFGGSLQVESVQALASKGLKNNIPLRYIRPHLKLEKISVDDSQSIPIIDMSKLENIDESLKLHYACKDWGFFQLINHGISDVIDEMKGVAEDFFKLPQEEKMVYAQVPGDIEGYGQANVLSEEQKLDWSNMLAIMTRPLPIRNMRFWPTSPPIFGSAMDAYSCKMEKVEIRLLRVIAKNLGIGPSEILVPFENGFQAIRLNYYPPCELADEVIGFTPHSDASGLTLLVQVNDVSGLQIKKDEKWALLSLILVLLSSMLVTLWRYRCMFGTLLLLLYLFGVYFWKTNYLFKESWNYKMAVHVHVINLVFHYGLN